MEKSKTQSKNYILTILTVFLSFFVVAPVLASEIFFSTEAGEIKINQQFEIKVFVNTEKKYMNAVEGEVVFPQDLLKIEEINDGNSMVNFWIEKPKSLQEGKISFSGITPGGYNNVEGLLFSVIFTAKKEGNGNIVFNNIKVLQNDGLGTKDSVTISSFSFLISKQALIYQDKIPEIIDNDPPEDFKPEITNSPILFAGKWFLVFATQDKGSGIDHYEVKEGDKPFIIVESPYLLQNQGLNEEIYVKAVDKDDNEKIVLLSSKVLMWYDNYILLAMVAGGILLVYFIHKFLWIKRKK